MKKLYIFFLLIIVAILTSCNPDVQFGSSDNVPKIAEKTLGMTPQKAISYMEKEGFTYEGEELHAQHPREYIFCKGLKSAQFSFDAPIVIWLNIDWNDIINSVDATQRMDSKQSARDLYWKWSHYTKSVFASHMDEWQAMIVSDGSIDYVGYSDREKFWTDLKNAGDALQMASEYYLNMDMPKEINMGITFEEQDEYILEYDTRNYIDIPVPCMPSKIRNGRPCY